MPGYTTENDFVIAEGAEGELYIYISAKTATPSNPQIIYDGCDSIKKEGRDEQYYHVGQGCRQCKDGAVFSDGKREPV